MIYSPSEDSFLMAEALQEYVRGKKVLDMGSGSGFLAEKSLNLGAESILAVDIDKDSVEFISHKGINALQSDLFEKVKGEFEVILFNPPYLPEDRREDEESKKITTGGKNGDEVILKFLQSALEHLKEKGIILLLLSSLTPKEIILSFISSNSLSYKIIASKSLFMERLEVWNISRNL